ncbi:glycine cleavage system protein GcvH [Myxococcota bacterium]|nr:glycine cleavage system protein GcvH [Myxococcota bacterium]MBU1536535.1 glycine cleavage system protein GcvH [Myxococcota bacterium]
MDTFKYAKSHEWFDPQTGRVGISRFAVDHLGEVVEVELPEVGAVVEKGEEIGTVESTKTASPLYSPISGTIVEVNEELEDSPEVVNDAPFGDGWIFVIEPSDTDELATLLDGEAYADLCAEEEE